MKNNEKYIKKMSGNNEIVPFGTTIDDIFSSNNIVQPKKNNIQRTFTKKGKTEKYILSIYNEIKSSYNLNYFDLEVLFTIINLFYKKKIEVNLLNLTEPNNFITIPQILKQMVNNQIQYVSDIIKDDIYDSIQKLMYTIVSVELNGEDTPLESIINDLTHKKITRMKITTQLLPGKLVRLESQNKFKNEFFIFNDNPTIAQLLQSLDSIKNINAIRIKPKLVELTKSNIAMFTYIRTKILNAYFNTENSNNVFCIIDVHNLFECCDLPFPDKNTSYYRQIKLRYITKIKQILDDFVERGVLLDYKEKRGNQNAYESFKLFINLDYNFETNDSLRKRENE